MDNGIGSLNASKKVTFNVVETEDVTESKPSLLTDSAHSLPKLTITTSSVDPAPLPCPNIGSRNHLAPARDTSWAAWRVLCGTILVFGILFAFPLAFGVFQNFYANDRDFSNATQAIWIGVLSTGIPYLGAPFMTVLFETNSHLKWKHYVIIGWAICAASLIGASFSKSLLVLTITQGMLYGLGLLILNVPALLILNTWFLKRRGTAYGLLFGACDLLGLGATILAEYLLHKYGLKGSLLTFGGILFAICGPAIWLLKVRTADPPRLATRRDSEELTLTPLTRRASSNLCSSSDTRYYCRPIFYIFTLAGLFHSFAYYLPFLYLPSYTTDLGYSPARGAYLLAAATFAMIFGEMGFGRLSDRFNVHILILIGSLVSSATALTLWGLAHSFVMLVFFALIFGCFSSGLISLWARMGTFFGQKDAQMIYSIMSLGRGLGCIVSGPISSALLAAGQKRTLDDSVSRYGNGKYLGVVLFVGVSMAVSALMGVVGLLTGWRGNQLGRVDRKRVKTNSSLTLKV